MQKTNNNSNPILNRKKHMVLLIAPIVIAPILCLMFGLLFAKDPTKDPDLVVQKGYNAELPEATVADTVGSKMEAQEYLEDEKNKALANNFNDVDVSATPTTEDGKPIANSRMNTLERMKLAEQQKTVQMQAPITNQELNKIKEQYSDYYQQDPGKPGGAQAAQEAYDKMMAKKMGGGQNGLPPDPNSMEYSQQLKNAYQNVISGGAGKKIITREDNSVEKRGAGGVLQASTGSEYNTMINAVISGDQKVNSQDGIVKMRLLSPLKYKDITLPANSYIFGVASGAASTNRLAVTIKNIGLGDKNYAVNWEIYDIDNNRGINVPRSGLESAQALNNASENVLNEADQTLNNQLNANAGAAAAASGVRVLGSFVRNKNQNRIRNIKVNLNNEYRILINFKQS
jgi:hypothetical protein